MSKKLEILLDKGEHLSFLQIHGRLLTPFKKFIRENIDIDQVDVENHSFPEDIEVKKEISSKNYKITITIEEDDET